MQIVHSSRRGSRDIEHIGSGRDEAEMAALRAAPRRRLAGGQDKLDLGLDDSAQAGSPLEITSSRMGHMWEALAGGYEALGFSGVTGDDEMFRQLGLARIIEPTSKLDSLRALTEAGVEPRPYRTLRRRLPVYATEQWRRKLAMACSVHAEMGPASRRRVHLVLRD